MTNKKKKVLILADISGMGLDYHVGDEAMAEVAISRLASILGRENLTVACASPSEASATYGIKAIPLYSRTQKQRRIAYLKRPHSALRELALLVYTLWRSDLVFVAGGGNHTSVWPHVLETRLFVYKLAHFLEKRIIFASQTLGPFTDKHRAACQTAFAFADWVGVRDIDYSANQLDIPVNFAVDDAVFLDTEHNDQTKAILGKNTKMVGLSLRNFQGVTKEQQEKLSESIARITNNNQETCIFFPHHAPAGIHGDLEIAKRISSLWTEKNPLQILDPIPYATAVKALTSHCRWVVTMRYHQLIFSLSVGVPSIGVYVDEYTMAKLNGAFQQFNLKPRLVSLSEAPGKIETLINDALSSKDEFAHAADVTLKNALKQNMRPYQIAQEILTDSIVN